jgi:N4-gp56 family major capsid protein
MATNTSAQFAGDVRRVLAADTLEVAQRYLTVYQFADKKKLNKHEGTSWTATRFNRLPLPLGPLSEGVPPVGETLTISQVTGVALQWGDKITFTDVSTITIQHDLLKEASERLGMQIAEMKERNGFNFLSGGTQVNYVNTRGARASLVAGDVLDPTTVNRTVSNLKFLGAPLWNGQTGEDVQRSIDHNARASTKGPMAAEHYVSIASPIVMNDFANNPLVVNVWSWAGTNDMGRLYINETGYWRGMHFCESNMLPTWTGIAQVNGSNAAGSLTTGTYTVQVTGWDTQNQYESQIYQLSGDVSVTTGGISVTLPSTAGFTYAVYVGVGSGAAPVNLGTSSSGPTSGPYAGQAISMAPGATVTITNIGVFQIPPAAPATGVTVYPTYVFGQRAFACLRLEDLSWTRLFEADKGDPLNQLRVIGWKLFEGWTILNQQFLARIESTASNSGSFG